MSGHNKFELQEKLLDKVQKIENGLISAYAFRNWLKNDNSLTDKDKAMWSDWIFQVTIYRSQLQNNLLEILVEELNKLAPSLEDGINELLEEINKAEDFIKAMDTLGRVVGLISKVVGLVAVPEVALPGAAVASFATVKKEALSIGEKKRTVYRKEPSLEEYEEGLHRHLKKDAVDTPPKAAPVKQVPVEEVLHGIELTPESLVITVATGGCTEKGSFEVKVIPRGTGLSPYLIVYRVKPDDCKKGDLEPIRISFSREELKGLEEGDVDFRVLNRIGNTSQHRLLP